MIEDLVRTALQHPVLLYNTRHTSAGNAEVMLFDPVTLKPFSGWVSWQEFTTKYYPAERRLHMGTDTKGG